MSLTQRLAQFTVSTRYDDLPAPVVAEARRLLLDTLGCAIGARDTESGRIALRYAKLLGGEPAATVLGSHQRNSATNAAYVNARLSNVLDADDTFPTGTHFANGAVFASLAVAQQFGLGGRELLTAIAVGFDVGARIGSWMGAPIQVHDGKVVGWAELGGPAATVTWAATGAAVRAAGLSAEQACHAFGIAGANCPLPTLRKWSESVNLPMHKYADAGWCAHTGVNAALLASLGSTGFAGILDGERAFWKFYGAAGHDDEALMGGLGEDWQILNTTYKPWPSCRWTQYPLTAFSHLQVEHQLGAEEIEHITVRANPFAVSARFRTVHPENTISSEFSHAHIMAVAAHRIPPGPLWHQPETIASEPIRAFREKVSVEPEPTAANLADWMHKGQFRRIPAGVDVHARGRVFSRTVDMAWGDPWSEDTRFTDAALQAKFRGMVKGCGSDERSALATKIIDCVQDIESLPDLSPLAQMLEAASVPQQR